MTPVVVEGRPLAASDGFDPHSGSLTERLLFNNRLVVMVLCLLATVVLGLQIPNLRLNAGFEKMIPTKHPFIANYLEHKNELAGLGNTLRIVVETTEGTIFNAQYMDVLRRMNDEVFLLPGVERQHMRSLWTPAVRWWA